jgi:phenylacetate-CoA ligase
LLVGSVLPANPFWQARAMRERGGAALRQDELSRFFPLTRKSELVADQAAHPPYGSNLTYPLARYTRCHQTSGTTGPPLRWLDTPESWEAMVDSWQEVLRAAGVGQGDRVLFAFSFGPFIGFWLAFEAAEKLGALCIPGGGLSSVVRLQLLLDNQVTVLCCTPTYALRLAETARQEEISLKSCCLRRIVVAGEPGGSLPATRQRIEGLWPGAKVFDHHGMTEVGPVTYECPAQPGVLHVMEDAFLVEVLRPETDNGIDNGQTGELVLTTLTRTGSPIFRYRTGDLVRPRFLPLEADVSPCPCGRYELPLEGGILGRVDDMVIVRGVNLFPSAVEEIIRTMRDVEEYQVLLSVEQGLSEVELRVEPSAHCPDVAGLLRLLELELQRAFTLRIPVFAAPPGTLPRFEMKAKRWIRRSDAVT